MASERKEALFRGNDSHDASSVTSDDEGQIFDPTRLIALLTEVAEAYAERAREPEVVEKTSGKEAVGIVKASVEVIHELSSPSGSPVGRGLRAPPSPSRSPWTTGVPARHSSPDEGRRSEDRVSASPPDGISILEEAVAEVCQYDPETAHLEPWARLIIRMDSLTKKLEQALLKPETANPKPETHPCRLARHGGAGSPPAEGSNDRVGGTDQCRRTSKEEDAAIPAGLVSPAYSPNVENRVSAFPGSKPKTPNPKPEPRHCRAGSPRPASSESESQEGISDRPNDETNPNRPRAP